MPDSDLPIPLEIPWRLVSSTQRLHEGFPEDTTISMFVYEPQTTTLDTDYPDEQLIYLKFTVSVSPIALDGSSLPDWISSQLVGGLPVVHMLLDIGVTPEPFATGGIRPYFHAASPLRRVMMETGVIGHQAFEGESDSVTIGRSASQLYENVGSKVTTSKKGSSGGYPGIFNVDRSRTETTVESERNVQQYQETTNRDASTERRELLSHLTKTENLLTLLNAKHVGSPFLRFALSPQPLIAPIQDGTDSQLWIRELVQQRSTGIEGIQEFIAVVAVPRGQPFCVQALLRRYAVLDNPPQSPKFSGSFLSPAEHLAAYRYLYEKYPIGTPVDLLDIDVTNQFEDTDFVPSIDQWSLHSPSGAAMGYAVYPVKAPWPETVDGAPFLYKTAVEIRRDMLMDAYVAELLRSPLERGVIVTRSNQLRTCFRPSSNNLRVGSMNVESTSPHEFRFTFGTSRSRSPRFTSIDSSIDASVTAANWAVLNAELARQAAAAPNDAGTPLSLSNEAVLDLLLQRWSQLDRTDRSNLPLDRAAVLLGLSTTSIAALRTAGVTNLSGIANVLLSAEPGEHINRELVAARDRLPKHILCRFEPRPMEGLLPVRSAQSIRAEIAQQRKPVTPKKASRKSS